MIKIGYFGTPSHAASLLELLVKNGFEVVFAVCNQDKPAGRKKILTAPPVKETALKYNIPVMQFHSVKNDEAIAAINSYNADIYIIFAYGKLIPAGIFNFPRLGTINLHGSLLPDLRGASPVQSALLNDYKTTGISLQYIVEELDAGDIIASEEIRITPEDTTESLFGKMTATGFQLLQKLLQQDPAGKLKAEPQNHQLATHCKKLKPEDRVIDFRRSATEIHNQIRAFVPGPNAFCSFRGKRLNIIKSVPAENHVQSGKPGELKIVDKKQFMVNCGDKPLILEVVQPESKNLMTAAEFINGYRLKDGDIFE